MYNYNAPCLYYFKCAIKFKYSLTFYYNDICSPDHINLCTMYSAMLILCTVATWVLAFWF